MANKTILVIGSQNPWLEVVLLARSSLFRFVFIVLCFSFRGPKEIVTLEYGAFESGHPLWSFLRLQPWINVNCENDDDFDYHFDVTIKRDIFRPNEFRHRYQVKITKKSLGLSLYLEINL